MERLATMIDEHITKIDAKDNGDSSATPSPIEASALDKSIHDDPHNNIGQSSEYDNIKENISTPGNLSTKNKATKKEIHSSKKKSKHSKHSSQQEMVQSDDVYEDINVSHQVKMEPILEKINESVNNNESSSSSLENSRPLPKPHVPPRSKPNTPQRVLPPAPNQNYNSIAADESTYDEVPK